MRGFFYYTLILLRKLPREYPTLLRRSKYMGNIVYHFGNYAITNAKYVAMELNKYFDLNRSSSKKEDLYNKHKYFLLTNSIAWDLAHRDIPIYLTGIRKVINALKNSTTPKRGARVVYMSGVGFVNKIASKSTNGYIMRALNTLVLELMTEAGIEVLDIYNMLYSVNDKFVNPVHYLFVYPDRQIARGEFGKVVANAIFTTMCM